MGAIQSYESQEKTLDPLTSFSNPYSPCFYLNNKEYQRKDTIQSVIGQALTEKSIFHKNENENLDNKTELNIPNYFSQTKTTLPSVSSDSTEETVNENEDDENLLVKSSSLQSDIRKLYKFKDFVGKGNFGSVRTAFRRNEFSMHKLFAVKSISKKILQKKALEDLIREVDIISSLDHPCIIKFYETFHDDFYFHIVTELCRGKDLRERVKNAGGKICEREAKVITMKILNAINYCHFFDIVHRDLKPENIIFESPKDDNIDNDEEEEDENKNFSFLKIIDFGLAIKKQKEEQLHTILGTPYYIAPEVLKGNYNEKCDIWSIGAITYFMLVGEEPFKGISDSEVFARIIYDEPDFNSPKFKNISKLAIDFLKKCLVKKAENRMSAAEALNHPWFEVLYKKIHSKDVLDENILYNLKNFEKCSRFKKLVMRYLINNMGHVELHTYQKAFYAFDIKKNAMISSEEILKIFNNNIPEKQIKNIMSIAGNKNYLTFTEFIICCIRLREFLSPEKLLDAFNFFDLDCNSYIDNNDIYNSLLRLGKNVINKQDIEKIIKTITKGKDNKINLENFLNIFSQDIDVGEYLKEINEIISKNAAKELEIKKAKSATNVSLNKI